MHQHYCCKARDMGAEGGRASRSHWGFREGVPEGVELRLQLDRKGISWERDLERELTGEVVLQRRVSVHVCLCWPAQSPFQLFPELVLFFFFPLESCLTLVIPCTLGKVDSNSNSRDRHMTQDLDHQNIIFFWSLWLVSGWALEPIRSNQS